MRSIAFGSLAAFGGIMAAVSGNLAANCHAVPSILTGLVAAADAAFLTLAIRRQP